MEHEEVSGLMIFKGKDGKWYELIQNKYGTVFIRRLRYDVDLRKMSPKKLEIIRNFAISHIENYGKKGKKMYKGLLMPISPALVGEKLSGYKSTKEALTQKEAERLRLWKEAFGVTEKESPSLFKKIKARILLALA
jgi:hypothetical protein